MDVKIIRYLMALLMLVWLGAIITISFYVAPSLFTNQSGVVPSKAMAGDIITPLLAKMFWTGWVVLPVVIALHGAVYASTRRQGRLIAVSALMLGVAWGSGLFSGTILTGKVHALRAEMKAKHGGFDETPKDDPLRAKFGMLHGISMMMSSFDMMLGLASFFCVTQLIGSGPASPVKRDESAA